MNLFTNLSLIHIHSLLILFIYSLGSLFFLICQTRTNIGFQPGGANKFCRKEVGVAGKKFEFFRPSTIIFISKRQTNTWINLERGKQFRRERNKGGREKEETQLKGKGEGGWEMRKNYEETFSPTVRVELVMFGRLDQHWLSLADHPEDFQN